MRRVKFSAPAAFHNGTPRGALFSREEIEQVADRIKSVTNKIEHERGQGKYLDSLDLPYAHDTRVPQTSFKDLFTNSKPAMLEYAQRIHESNGQYVHLGIGGSSLGATTLVEALGKSWNDEWGGQTEVHIPDNIDPDMIGRLYGRLDAKRVFVNAVSKSGNTVETVANFMILLDLLRKAGLSDEELAKRVVVTTSNSNSVLFDYAKSLGCTVFPFPENVHGRFSVFSYAGLLTAAVAGIDIDGLLEGARAADRFTTEAPFWDNPAECLAALHYIGNTRKQLSGLVLMPYSYRLRTVANWYAQLMGESLAKGGLGMTPIRAFGTTDQHSQLQLYNEGPKDKLVVFFSVSEYGEAKRVPRSIESVPAFAYLAEHSLGDLVKIEQQATEISLHQYDVPSCKFTLDRIDAFSVGALLMVLEKTVCILGELFGIDTFDQPSVDEGKKFARALLRRTGPEFEQLRETAAILYPEDRSWGSSG